MSVKRTVILFSFILFSFLILIFRIYDIVQNDSAIYTNRTSNSYKITIDTSRGIIYDRNLIPIVSNDKEYKVSVMPSIESKAYLHSVLDEPTFKKINSEFSKPFPFTFTTENFIPETKDVNTFLVKRRYSENQIAKHIVGYCDTSQSIGLSGIEKAYDSYLTSENSSLSISYPIDATGRMLSGLSPTISDDNYNSPYGIALTIDSKIQKIAESASKSLNGNGSALIMDVNNGDILASVSLPEFDPNNIAKSIESGDTSLINRNLYAYNIGSTFKIIVSAAALSKNLSPLSQYTCNGSIKIGNTSFSCHKYEGHGVLNMETAFANSCNPYFVTLGQKIGKERLLSLSSAMGIGKPIKLCDGIVTAAGNIPSTDELTSLGDLANISFGQGSLMATPVHIAKITSIIANGGYNIEPNLVIGKVDKNGDIQNEKNSQQATKIIDIDTAKKIQKFMVTTIESGTGKNAKPTNLLAGGKTASAETGWKQNGEEIVQAWFSGFYPANSPKYAIVILCEGGNSGAASCAPIFKKICDSLYENGFCN